MVTGRPRIDLAGVRFGRLTALGTAGKTRGGKTTWLCVCDCGVSKEIATSILMTGHAQSCGCLRREAASRTAKVYFQRKGR